MSELSRRHFLQSAAAAALVSTVSGSLLRGAEQTAAGRKLNIAMIGIGTRGTPLFKEILPLATANVVALCDVDSAHLAKAGEMAPGATRHADFRDALKQPGIEAVVIATPDHTHAVIAAAAMR